jgi:hypothetical protein
MLSAWGPAVSEVRSRVERYFVENMSVRVLTVLAVVVTLTSCASRSATIPSRAVVSTSSDGRNDLSLVGTAAAARLGSTNFVRVNFIDGSSQDIADVRRLYRKRTRGRSEDIVIHGSRMIAAYHAAKIRSIENQAAASGGTTTASPDSIITIPQPTPGDGSGDGSGSDGLYPCDLCSGEIPSGQSPTSIVSPTAIRSTRAVPASPAGAISIPMLRAGSTSEAVHRTVTWTPRTAVAALPARKIS